MATLAERVAMIMSERGLSAAQLAEASGVGAGTLSRYLSGERQHPRIDQVAAIASALGVTLGWLYDGSPPRDQAMREGDPEIAAFAWPASTAESIRIAVQQKVLAERDAHRRALIPYWHARMTALLTDEQKRKA